MRRFAALVLLALASAACGERPGGADPEAARADSAAAADPTAEAAAVPGETARPYREIAPGAHGVYVPAYSHIYHHRGEAFLLTTTLSIRNTDVRDSLTVTSVRYYDTGGELLETHLPEPRTLEPLETMEVVIQEDDVSGGSGANFIVEWRSDAPVNPPVVETVMISTALGQGVSFTSRGVPIEALER